MNCGPLERRWQRPRLMAMMRAGATAFVAMAALAGCASGVATPVASPAIGAANSGAPVQAASISVGSPSPTDSASRSRVRVVTELATRLLSGVGIPPGAVDHDGGPVGAFVGPAQHPMSDNLIDVANSWVVPGTLYGDLAYLKQHLPSGLTLDGASVASPVSGGTGSQSLFYRAAAGPDDQGAELLLTAASDSAGGVDLRVDVQDVWQPIRPASDLLPATVSGATLVSRTGLTTTPPPPTTVHVNRAAAQHIAEMLNALPTQAGGAAPGAGPPNATISITFDNDPSGVAYVAAGSFYDTVTINAPNQQPLTLSNAATVVNYLATFLPAQFASAPASTSPSHPQN